MFNDHKQFQGSKKKARNKAYLERQTKRDQEKRNREYFNRVMHCGNPERIAGALGIKLK